MKCPSYERCCTNSSWKFEDELIKVLSDYESNDWGYVYDSYVTAIKNYHRKTMILLS